MPIYRECVNTILPMSTKHIPKPYLGDQVYTKRVRHNSYHRNDIKQTVIHGYPSIHTKYISHYTKK